MRRTSLFLLSYAFVIIQLFTRVEADTACDFQALYSSRNPLGTLDMLYAKGCMGGPTDTNPLTIRVQSKLTGIEDTARNEVELTVERNALLGLLSEINGSLTSEMGLMDAQWQSYASIVINQLAIVQDDIQDFQSIVPAEYWQRHQDYGFFEQQATGKFLIYYEANIMQACGSSELATACRHALSSAVELTRHVALVHAVLQNPVRDRLEIIHLELVKLDDEWSYYFDKARSQYWWEFLANNTLYKPEDDKLARPPAGQLILAHPNVAMEYVGSNGEVDSALNLIGIIEIIGYNRLRWNQEGPMSKWPLGISFTATYVPVNPGSNFGYGLMIHIKNNLSFGATQRDTGDGNEITWVLSVDLSKLFLTKSQEARDIFRGFD